MRLLRYSLVLVVLCLSYAGFGQNASTSLRGLVTDPAGAAIPGASVVIVNAANGVRVDAVTNSQGEYSLQQIAPGTYTITATAPGFGKFTTTAQLLVAQPATVNMKLQVSADVVSVDVSAATETINTTDATIGNAINNETIMQLPSEGRNPQTLLALQPGVLFIGSNTQSTESRNGVVSGARSDQTNITLDGVDNNNQVNPAAFSGVLRNSLDATEQFRVTTSSSNADTGRSSGGQVNLVTKSGTNQIHGSTYWYNRSNLGVANDWFNKAAQINSGLPNTPGHLIRNTYGISLGGPLKKDKIFLFGNYEGNRQNEAAPTVRTVPTDSLRAGNLMYTADDGSNVTLTPSQFASMDPNCFANGTCPWGPGVNPNSIALFQLYPHSNGFTEGDGLNTGSYSFAASVPEIQNVYIARLDYNINEKHRIYVRASMQNDADSFAPYYPGQPASQKDTDNSKGISANYTWTPTANIVNNLRYGFIRQSIASTGAGNGQYVTFRSLDTPEARTRSSATIVPTHNILDDYTWTRGRHTVQVGVNYRRFTYQNTTNANSYSGASANYAWMLESGFAGIGGSFDPAAFGFPNVSDGFGTNYNLAVSMLAGLTNEETANFNYKLSADGTTGTLLGVGVPVDRSFRSNEFEYYVQDAFRPLPNLTLTAGLRHTILQTPYETNGQQVQPTIDMHQWFLTRGQQAAVGNSVQPDISFAPSGQARGAKPFYPMNWHNIAPRLAIAFAPAPEGGTWLNKLLGGAGRSSIRVGYGMYYDHYGQGLVTNYSKSGSFSLSSSITNPASVQTADTTPRFTGLHNLPNLVPSAPSSIGYPQTPSNDPSGTGFAITYGLDDHLQTPYSHVFNLSFQRELPGGFTLEANYVGRLGRHLLQSIDLAQPLDLVDPKSGMDYYTAGTMMSQFVDQGRTDVPTIPYWENLFPGAAGPSGGGPVGSSATQNIYDNEWVFARGNETAALYDLDIACTMGCPNGPGRFWPLQYSSLYVTSSNGTSSYHAGQFVLRHPMAHNVQIDLSYTYSKSLDLGSDSESNPTNVFLPSGAAANFGMILDAWNPRKNYAVSDFDTAHLLTADWVWLMPFGRGQHYGGNVSHLVDALIGNWNLAGIARVSSGLPFGISDGLGWSTNWEWQSNMVQTGPIKMRKHQDANGSPQAFDDPIAAAANMRSPYPGEAGQRNQFRGDGYFDVDLGLHKGFHFGDRYLLNLAGEVFNLTNSTRFDVHSLDTGSTDGPQMGVYSATLTQYRRMQVSARFQF
ncbi:outer membrane receptor protein involved in Fe transport [Edaphobacter aggregans]|uniref:Outer membrane receptor protein involved in Fe transport n=1 Tax=Edaphobacter aggregans TaxID=570835 RepID=A0A428MD99_9BACT|nr:carboxypeptidase regulatory-like domain-containing protein [Edaphobacter aggregans]RSL14819.1 outer membrane receptor protein involved in Fe transport [Edaphobacter aggregans]